MFQNGILSFLIFTVAIYHFVEGAGNLISDEKTVETLDTQVSNIKDGKMVSEAVNSPRSAFEVSASDDTRRRLRNYRLNKELKKRRPANASRKVPRESEGPNDNARTVKRYSSSSSCLSNVWDNQMASWRSTAIGSLGQCRLGISEGLYNYWNRLKSYLKYLWSRISPILMSILQNYHVCSIEGSYYSCAKNVGALLGQKILPVLVEVVVSLLSEPDPDFEPKLGDIARRCVRNIYDAGLLLLGDGIPCLGY